MKDRIKTINYTRLPELYKMLARSFNRENGYFIPFVEKNPGFYPSLFLYTEKKGRIASCVQILELNAYIKGKLTKIGGIGQVATLPEFRGQGLASELLKACLKRMKEMGYAFSLLFAGPVPLYQKIGFKLLDVKYYFFEGVLLDHKGPFTILPMKEKYNYTLFDIHQEFIKHYNMTISRNFLYWQYYWKEFKARGCQTFLLKEKNLVAYITIKEEKDKIGICEYGSYRKNNGDDFTKLLAFVLIKTKKNQIYINCGNDHYTPVKVLKRFCKNYSTNNQKGFMVRDINRKYNWKDIKKKTLYFSGDRF
ncbi:MAG: GNAT family N-acetyltransferase [Spirochaetes bacterium]|nr:GNAT family N-acetyltransferase [Spirochaetota bacterium]